MMCTDEAQVTELLALPQRGQTLEVFNEDAWRTGVVTQLRRHKAQISVEGNMLWVPISDFRLPAEWKHGVWHKQGACIRTYWKLLFETGIAGMSSRIPVGCEACSSM